MKDPLLSYYRNHVKGRPLGEKAHFWLLIVIASPFLIAFYLGAWAEGWLEEGSQDD